MTVQVFNQVAHSHARAMRAGGYWRDQTFDKTLAKAVSQSPDKIAVIGCRAYRRDVVRFTCRDRGDRGDRGDRVEFLGVQTRMTESKVAKQYGPERLELVADLPPTPVGKVQKFKLRELLATGAARA